MWSRAIPVLIENTLDDDDDDNGDSLLDMSLKLFEEVACFHSKRDILQNKVFEYTQSILVLESLRSNETLVLVNKFHLYQISSKLVLYLDHYMHIKLSN